MNTDLIIFGEHKFTKIYVEGILGLKVEQENTGKYVLTEQYQNQIIKEHLLYEGILDSLKQAAGNLIQKPITFINNAATFSSAMFKIISDPSLISSFIKNTFKMITAPVIKYFEELLKNIKNVQFLAEVYNFLSQKIASLKAYSQKMFFSGGYKAVFFFAALGSILVYVKQKVEQPFSTIMDLMKGDDLNKDGQLNEIFKQLKEMLFSVLGPATQDLIQKIGSAITDIKTYLGWIGPIVGGASFVFNTFDPVMKKVLKTARANAAPQTEGRMLKEEMTKTEIKDIIKDEINKVLKVELKKMVEEELKKVLKDRNMQNEIGDISKEILKKLYKDLSLHHTYVIDRVKL